MCLEVSFRYSRQPTDAPDCAFRRQHYSQEGRTIPQPDCETTRDACCRSKAPYRMSTPPTWHLPQLRSGVVEIPSCDRSREPNGQRCLRLTSTSNCQDRKSVV